VFKLLIDRVIWVSVLHNESCKPLGLWVLFGWVVNICSTFLYSVALWVFAACLCIWLCCEYYLVGLWIFVARFCIRLRFEYLQHVSVFGCVASICSAFLYLVALWVFAARFCIWLCCEYYLVALWVFAAHFYIWLRCEYLQHVSVFWLCCEYLQHVSVFDCVVSICSTFLYLVGLWVFAARFCIWLCCEYYLVGLWIFVARFCIQLRCEYLQRVSVFGCVVSICIRLRCEHLQYVSVFGCVASICSMFLYLVSLWVLFGWVVNICSTFLYSVAPCLVRTRCKALFGFTCFLEMLYRWINDLVVQFEGKLHTRVAKSDAWRVYLFLLTLHVQLNHQNIKKIFNIFKYEGRTKH